MAEENNLQWISGFWRRIGALLLDSVILGLAGMVLGLVFEQQFVQLGGWGRLVGFIIAFIYFGVMNSRVCTGQTFGKKLLKIRVVDSENQAIDVLRSFARYSILGIPFFLNGAQLSNKALSSYWMYPISFLIFGVFLSVSYLYIFNRVSRQSLHDLIVGTFVVNADAEKQETGDLWRPHLMVVGALFVIAAIVPVFTSDLAQKEPFRELLSAQTALMENPSVRYATVSYGKSSSGSGNQATQTTTYVSARAILRQNSVSDEELSRHLARVLASYFSGPLQTEFIQISLTYGYDIGIGYQWRTHTRSFTPEELSGRE